MTLDHSTLFVATGICAMALSLAMSSAWLQSRADRPLIVWAAGLSLLGAGAVLYYAADLDIAFLSITSFTLYTLGFMLVFIATHEFTSSRSSKVLTLGWSGFAIALVVSAVGIGLIGVAVALFNVTAATFLILTARYFWRIRTEAPTIIAVIVSLYALAALSFLLCSAQVVWERNWVMTARPDNWAENLNAIVTMAGLAGIGALSLSLNQSRSVKRHRAEATIDSLTGLLNRRALQDHLVRKKIRPGDAVIVFDLDAFKCINDRFGHAVGDDVLHQFGAVLLETRGEGTLAARLGGEEFVLVVRHTTGTRAVAIAEQVREAFSRKSLVPSLVEAPVTTSAGISLAMSEDEGFQAVFGRADVALYRAKNLGRDRVCVEV